MQRGVIGEEMPIIDIDSRLLEGPEPEQPPFAERDEPPTQERDFDFGR